MCFCFVKELNCFTNHYFSLPFSSEVFTESKVEVKMRFFHLLLCCWVSASMAAVPVILDTDLDFDVDDVGALCVLHALQVWEDLIIMGTLFEKNRDRVFQTQSHLEH